MIDRIRLAGHGTAEVIQHGQTWFEADLHLRTVLLPNDPDGVYVPPFDHADIWTGASGMVDEIEEDLGGCADVVVCSVGGGGLFCGIMQGLEHSTGTKIIAVETKGADSLAQSVAAGELITLPGITSIATSLGATRVASQALKYAQEDRVKCWVVSDEQACGACVRFADGERMLVEPACGAALSVVYEDLLRDRALRLAKESRVVVVVCGGVGVGVEMIAEWRAAGLGSGLLL